MIKIIKLTKYSKALAERVRALLIQLSRSGQDKGTIPKAWFDELIASSWHDCLLAVEVEAQSESHNSSESLKQPTTPTSAQAKNPASTILDDVASTELLEVIQPSQILGMASVSITFGPGIGKNAYLEDFVVDKAARGKGIGHLLFDAYEKWAREKGCKNLEFTCGHGRESAQQFYKDHGSSIYGTNFFRKKLN